MCNWEVVLFLGVHKPSVIQWRLHVIPLEGYCKGIDCCSVLLGRNCLLDISSALPHHFSVLENSPVSSLLSNAAIPRAIPCAAAYTVNIIFPSLPHHHETAYDGNEDGVDI